MANQPTRGHVCPSSTAQPCIACLPPFAMHHTPYTTHYIAFTCNTSYTMHTRNTLMNTCPRPCIHTRARAHTHTHTHMHARTHTHYFTIHWGRYDPARKGFFLQYQHGPHKGEIYNEPQLHGLKQCVRCDVVV